MTKRKFLISILLFLLYAAIVWFGASALVPGINFFLVVFVSIALGLTVLVVYLLIARMHAPAAAAPAESGQDEKGAAPARPVSKEDPEVAALAALINEANNRLANSPKLASRRVRTTGHALAAVSPGRHRGRG
jgi:Zn-dependent protease with chaperone function